MLAAAISISMTSFPADRIKGSSFFVPTLKWALLLPYVALPMVIFDEPNNYAIGKIAYLY